MYLIAIGWLYVALMMAVVEASSTTGSVLGAVITFVLYGLAPTALLMYVLVTPGRRRVLKAREAQAEAAHAVKMTQMTQMTQMAQAAPAAQMPQTTPGSLSQPNAGSEAPTDAIAPVRKEL
jgi:mannose/fructose/N-acetylgalactosamine-specific phosphotransferase system component IID